MTFTRKMLRHILRAKGLTGSKLREKTRAIRKPRRVAAWEKAQRESRG